MWYNEKSKHEISKALLKKGFRNFEFGKCYISNYNTKTSWYIDVLDNDKSVLLFLGGTIKESVFNIDRNVLDFLKK